MTNKALSDHFSHTIAIACGQIKRHDGPEEAIGFITRIVCQLVGLVSAKYGPEHAAKIIEQSVNAAADAAANPELTR